MPKSKAKPKPQSASSSPPKPAGPHVWSFYRAGGVDQVRLDSGADIFHLDELDQKLWVALSCPTSNLEIDERMLELIDADGDAHVRPPEILKTVAWLRDVLKDGDVLVEGVDGVSIDNIRKETEAGKSIYLSMKHALRTLGSEGKTLTVDQTVAVAAEFAKARYNGDGVVPPATIEQDAARAVAEHVVACMGGKPDRSGEPGYDQDSLDAFFAACAEFDAWHRAAEADRDETLPFGDDTAAAHAALNAVRAKVDDYFGRCRLAAFDARALAAVNREQEAYIQKVAQDLTITADEVADFPLSMVEAGKPLDLVDGVNPAWQARVDAFRATCCKGKKTLTEADWAALCAKFGGYEAWLGKAGGAAVAGLGLATVREVLAGDAREVLQTAIANDLLVGPEFDAMVEVERLARLQREFGKLLRNFVSFTDFYAREGAIFQAGTLHLDGRTCEMCFHVNDAGKHAKMAPMSNAFLAYVDCTRPGGAKMSVACAFTDGDSDNLFEGRNGIFYDRDGNDWDATVTRIVVNPISVRQAFWSPYKRALRGLQAAIAKRAEAADAAATSKLETDLQTAGADAAAGKAPPKPKFEIGTIAALGVAVGGISTALTGLLMGFLDLGPWIPLGILGLLLAISGPSMFIAWLKLRTRNLGPILDANGWAVNVLTRVNIPLGKSLTGVPKIPANARRSLVDPYAPKKSIWPRVLLVLLLLAGTGYVLYRTNLLHRWLPDYIPAHHAETGLMLVEGQSAEVEAGATVEFVVRSSAPFLVVTRITEDDAPVEMQSVPVTDGKARLEIPAEAQPGVLEVRDTASDTTIELTIAAKAGG